MSAPCTFHVIYDPPEYGEIIPSDQCKHDPAGHRMDLGIDVDFDGRGGSKIIVAGHICLKCGAGSHVDAENWWDLWHIARAELSPLSWKFTKRLFELAYAAGGLPKPRGIPHCRAQSLTRSSLNRARRLRLKVRFSDGRKPWADCRGVREFVRQNHVFTRLSLRYLPGRRSLPKSQRAA